MHKRLYKFLDENIYPCQFGFDKNTSFALIYLTETIKGALDQGKYGCGIFVDLQKAFGTVDHNILMGKLKHYGIIVMDYSWFQSYLKARKRHISINGFYSKNLPISHGVPMVLDHYYFFFTSKLCIRLLNSARFIILLMILIFHIK